MNDSPRVLLVAAVLSAAALALFAAQVGRTETATPHRLIGQMRLAQWAALLLAASSGITVGVLVISGRGPLSGVDTALAVILAGAAALALQREPRPALLIVTTGLVAHALLTIAHRPGWLPADALPRWYAIGSAVYDTVIAAICAWTWRR